MSPFEVYYLKEKIGGFCGVVPFKINTYSLTIRDPFTPILMFSHNVIYNRFLTWVGSHAAFGLVLHPLINMIRCGVKVCSPLSARSLLTGENISIILFYLPFPSPALTSAVNSAGLRESPDPHLSRTRTHTDPSHTHPIFVILSQSSSTSAI